MRATLLQLVEEPGLWIPLLPPGELIEGDGYCMVTALRSASIERIRLAPDAVEGAIEAVRAAARERGLEHVTWWLGELTRPAGLAERLLELGFEPDRHTPEMTSLTIARPPEGEPTVEVRRVRTADEFLQALELDWDVWEVPEDERAAYRPLKREAWALIEASGRESYHVAYLDGEPAGFARVVFTPHAAILLGGSTLPDARGRGVYTSLVHARWRETVERGVPRIVVSAGPMSAPILGRLGFEAIGTVRLLRDRL
jgi:Acetyltransferase (GNAT) domain